MKTYLNKAVHIAFFFLVFVGILFSAVAVPSSTVLAQGTTTTSQSPLGYIPLAPLPDVDQSGDVNLADYLNAMYRIFLGIAAIAAVAVITGRGIQYATSDSDGKKTDAKKKIWNAVWGLILAMASWLILNTINPELLDFNLKLEPIDGTSVVSPTPNTGEPWPDDSGIRAVLANNGISVNKNSCAHVGATNCTSVIGVSAATVAKLRDLKNACGCNITITGGTEHWLHSTHGPGNILDLRVTGELNGYINADNKPLGCYDKIQHADGNTYQWEPPGCGDSTGAHWHVIF